MPTGLSSRISWTQTGQRSCSCSRFIERDASKFPDQHHAGDGDQGNQGSCTAWSTGYAARAYYAAAVEQRRVTLPQSIPSPAFLYNQNVGFPGDCESGSSNILALDTLKYGGALSLADWGQIGTGLGQAGDGIVKFLQGDPAAYAGGLPGGLTRLAMWPALLSTKVEGPDSRRTVR